ncbi:MAG TPA: RNA polymerase sigma factor [Candidatus Angelobacter sp.]|nr:RNA polymerase sigma factor [Candidatus Angelobacter sp.]
MRRLPPRSSVIDNDFDQLITAQIPHLRRYAYALMGDRDRADDLVQDCLERAWSRAHLWREGNIRGWLFTIMHNVSVNARRRDYRAPPLTSLDRPGLEPSTRATQEDHLSIAALRDAVNSLPREQEEVILLVGLEEFSYAETADILGVPMGTVMSRLHRGRERLRQLLTNQGGASLRRVK